MKNNWRVFIDRWYLGCMIVIAFLMIYLNWHAQNMAGLLSGYQHYKAIILAGFEYHTLITFPMWGYGWLMLLTESKFVLLSIQMSLALGALYLFIRFLEQEQLFSVITIRIFKVCMMLSLPWYAFHALRWPYSIATSLFLISFMLLYKAVIRTQKSWVKLLLSAVCFGLLLNFRSDYILMPLGFAVLIVLFLRTQKSLLQMFVWLVVLYGCLIPWAVYTKKACGHYLFTSTNSGHVLFAGLGNDPSNTWGIAGHDGDPLMHALVDKHFNQHNHSTLDYEADQFLKTTFFSYIQARPWDYAKKCFYVFRQLITSGFYPGEFLAGQGYDAFLLSHQRMRNVVIWIAQNPSFIIEHFYFSMRVLIQTLSWLFGVLVLFVSYFVLPFTLYSAYKKRSLIMGLVLASIMYQTLLNMCCFHMSAYLGNVNVLYVCNLLYAVSLINIRKKCFN